MMKRRTVYVRTENPCDQLMKTDRDKRNTYTYRYHETETINGVTHDITKEIELISGEDEVTKDDIKRLYAMDDHLVYENLKARKPELEDWQKKIIADFKADFIKKFTERHGYEPNPADVEAEVREKFPRNWVASIEQMMSGSNGDDDDDMGDKAGFLLDAWKKNHQPQSPSEERLADLVETWPESWQEIYARVLIEGETIVSIARERGVTEGAVRKTVRKIKAAIVSDAELLRIRSH
jgi:hypothetical protein